MLSWDDTPVSKPVSTPTPAASAPAPAQTSGSATAVEDRPVEKAVALPLV